MKKVEGTDSEDYQRAMEQAMMPFNDSELDYIENYLMPYGQSSFLESYLYSGKDIDDFLTDDLDLAVEDFFRISNMGR